MIYGMKEVERVLIKRDNYSKEDIDNMELYEFEYLVDKLKEEMEK